MRERESRKKGESCFSMKGGEIKGFGVWGKGG